MGRSIDRTLENNMVDGLFFCATLTGCRGGHTPFVQAGVETPRTGAGVVKPDPGSSWEGHSGRVGAGVGDESMESRRVLQPLRIPSVILNYAVYFTSINNLSVVLKRLFENSLS